MELFDVIRAMYSGRSAYEKVTSADKTRNRFMINRLHGIQYPIQANLLNALKVNPVAVVDYWARELGSKYTSTPDFMYSKGKKGDKAGKKDYFPSDETIEYYCRRNRCSRREITEALRTFGAPFEKELKQIDKLFEMSEKM